MPLTPPSPLAAAAPPSLVYVSFAAAAAAVIAAAFAAAFAAAAAAVAAAVAAAFAAAAVAAATVSAGSTLRRWQGCEAASLHRLLARPMPFVELSRSGCGSRCTAMRSSTSRVKNPNPNCLASDSSSSCFTTRGTSHFASPVSSLYQKGKPLKPSVLRPQSCPVSFRCFRSVAILAFSRSYNMRWRPMRCSGTSVANSSPSVM
mmetsp:Transcript_71213/g.139917  ORF Transcript_71213/g.139917 Transcript_71213/m.139917 type:complete len:203 (+) Transcript_71213:348-956(+)